jgi:hypothetical protein
MAIAKNDIKSIPLDHSKPVYILHDDGSIEEGFIMPRSLEKDPVDKHKDRLYIVFLLLGIVSFGLGALTQAKRLNGGGKS